MKNMIETFKVLAGNANLIKNEHDAINTERKSVTDQMQWAAFFITMQGTPADKEALKALVAKDAPYEKQKGSVSRAKKVAAFLLEREVIQYDNKELTLKYIRLYEPLEGDKFTSPTEPFNAIFKAVSDTLKSEEKSKEAASEEKALMLEAFKVGQVAMQYSVEEALEFEAEVIEHGLAIINQRKEANKLQEILASLTPLEKQELARMLQESNTAQAIAA